jgi:hypothetical protein
LEQVSCLPLLPAVLQRALMRVGACSTVHGLTFNVQKLFMDMDARLWEECTQKHKMNMEK